MKAVCFYGWKHILNVLSIIRTADGLGFDEILLVSRKRPILKNHKKMSLSELDKIQHKIKMFNSFDNCFQYMLDNYRLVCVELNRKATSIYNYSWKSNPCIIVGHEREGIPQYLMDVSDTIYIPMQNKIKCLNVGCCASIAMYDYVNKKEKP